MVEVENIQLNHRDFIGIYLNLPQYPIHFIMSTHSILAQENFSMEHFNHIEKDVAVILCTYTFGFDGLLSSVVVDCNQHALNKGVCKGMIAKEALILCEENTNQAIPQV